MPVHLHSHTVCRHGNERSAPTLICTTCLPTQTSTAQPNMPQQLGQTFVLCVNMRFKSIEVSQHRDCVMILSLLSLLVAAATTSSLQNVRSTHYRTEMNSSTSGHHLASGCRPMRHRRCPLSCWWQIPTR